MKYQGYRFYFDLSPHLSANRLTGSKEIEFRLEVRNTKKIVTGFSVKVLNMKKVPAMYHAKQKATMLTNFISVKYGGHSRHIYTGYNAIMKNGLETVRRDNKHRWKKISDLDLDLNDKRIAALLNDREQALSYNYASRGMRSYDDQDPVGMIRDFYQLVEHDQDWKKLPKNLRRFKWLRDVLSHKGARSQYAMVQVTKNFRRDSFDTTPNGYFDFTSSKNIQHLQEQAEYLMEKALGYLPY